MFDSSNVDKDDHDHNNHNTNLDNGAVSGKRARELFNALDDDGNGFLTEDEFVQGGAPAFVPLWLLFHIVFIILLISYKKTELKFL